MKEEKVEVFRKHFHIDNGGYTFSLDLVWNGSDGYWTEGLKIHNSFFGYAENTMQLGHFGEKELEVLGKTFLEAAERIRKLNETVKLLKDR